MSKVAAANRRARQQLREFCLDENEAALLALVQIVVGATKARHRKVRTYTWSPVEQFARLGVRYAIPTPANEEEYERR